MILIPSDTIFADTSKKFYDTITIQEYIDRYNDIIYLF